MMRWNVAGTRSLIVGMLAVGMLVVGQTAWGQRAGEDRAQTKTGEVIQANEGQLVIETEDQEQVTIRTDEQTDVRLDGRETDLDDLQRGMTVHVTMRPDGKMAQRVMAQRERDAQARQQREGQAYQPRERRESQQQGQAQQRQQTLRGEVVRAEEDALLIRTEDDQQYRIRVDENAQVMLDGRQADLEDLQRGTTVQVTLDREGKTVERIQAQRDDQDRDRGRGLGGIFGRDRGRDDQQQTLRGEVIRAEQDELTIRTQDGQQRRVQADRQTQVTIDGRRGDLQDLDRGMQVQVTLDQQGRSAERIQAQQDDQRGRQQFTRHQDQQHQQFQDRQRQQTLRGEVVRAEQDQLTIRTQDGQQQTLQADRWTQVMLDGRRADVEDLNRGMQVQVTLDERGRSAERIHAQQQDDRERYARDEPFRDRQFRDQQVWQERDAGMQHERRAALGIRVEDTVRVVRVHEDSPAEQAGLRDGDYILEIEGQEIASTRDVMNILRRQDPGRTVRLTIWRDGRERTVQARLASSDEVFENDQDRRRDPRLEQRRLEERRSDPRFEDRRSDQRFEDRRFDDHRFDDRRFDDRQFDQRRFDDRQFQDRQFQDRQFQDRQFQDRQSQDRQSQDRQSQDRGF